MADVRVLELRPDMTGALESLDDLRAKVESGEIVMFCAVGVEKDDSTRMWVGSAHGSKTKLQWMGALTHLLLTIWHEELK